MSYAKHIDFFLSQVRNSVGSLAGGKIWFYGAGGTTPKTIWLDRDKTSPAANPYTLDANGTAQLYADGLYKIVIKNSAGATIYTRDNIFFNYYDILYEIDALDQYGGGTSYTKATIDAALLAIGITDKVTLLLRPGTWDISAPITFTSNISLKTPPGVKLTKSGTGALAINGPSDIGFYQIFYGFSAGNVTFGVGSVKEVYPQWWETNAIPDTTDMTVAIQSALNAFSNVKIIKGIMKITAALAMNQYNKLHGDGIDSVIHQATAYTKGVLLNHDCTVKNLRVTGNASSTTFPNNSLAINSTFLGGVYANRGTTDGEWLGNRCNIEDMWIDTWGMNGLGLACYNNIRRVKISDCKNEGIITGGDYLNIDDLQIDNVKSWGVDINNSHIYGHNIRLTNCGDIAGPATTDSGGLVITGDPNAVGVTDIKLSKVSITGGTCYSVFVVSDAGKTITDVNLVDFSMKDVCHLGGLGVDSAGIYIINNDNVVGTIADIRINDITIDGVDDGAGNGAGIKALTVKNLTITNPKIKNVLHYGINIAQHAGKVNSGITITNPEISAWAGVRGIQIVGDILNITNPQIKTPTGTGAGYLVFLDGTNFSINGGVLKGETTGHIGLGIGGVADKGVVTGLKVDSCLTGIEYSSSNGNVKIGQNNLLNNTTPLSLITNPAGLVIEGCTTKIDTGDPASGLYEGLIEINTFDNKVKIYAEGAWRQLATW